MYSVGLYGDMIGDGVRMRAYGRALREAVKPGSVVLDIGTGTGIFAMLACRYGARRVYAVEPSDAIQVARDIAAANGCADRIRFLQRSSTEVSLPERADVIVSDLRGVLPLYERHLPSIVDARQRLLAPGGTLIPLRDMLQLAVVEAGAFYDRLTRPWGENADGLDMEPARLLLANRWSRCSGERVAILLPPRTWATLDYTRLTDADVHGEVRWTARQAGTAHGLLVWFDGVIADGVQFTNAPGEPELIYGRAFFPLLQPVAVAVGDEVTVTLDADLVSGDYVWRWNTAVVAPGNRERPKASFRQSTFFGTPLSPAQWRRTAAAYVPRFSEEGEIARFILQRMDGTRSLEAIAAEVADRFPGRFPRRNDALGCVGMLSKAYSRPPEDPPS